MNCKCNCLLHDGSCDVPTKGECGDLCQMCVHHCKNMSFNVGINQECKHNNVVVVRYAYPNLRRNLKVESNFSDNYINHLIEALDIDETKKIAYCKICKYAVDAGSCQAINDGTPIIQMNRKTCACGCIVDFCWYEDDNKEVRDIIPYRTLKRCKNHNQFTKNLLLRRIMEYESEENKKSQKETLEKNG